MENGTSHKPTNKEISDFVKHKNGYTNFSSTSRPQKNKTNGQLILIEGVNKTVIHYDKPFALLNYLKTQMIKNGYKKENLFIRSI